MFRPALVLILSATVSNAAVGNLDVLGPGTDINDAVNYSSFVFFDWNGDGREEVAGVDAAKARFYLSSVDFPGIYIGGGMELAPALTDSAVTFTADTDGDSKADLILVDGTRLRIWKAKPRTAMTASPPDVERQLPSAMVRGSWAPALADFDSDGSPDLFLPGEGSPETGRVIFSFTTHSPQVVELPSDSRVTRVGPPWTTGGPPTMVSGDGGYHGGLVKVYAAGQNRTISLVETTPHPGTLVEIDGHAPPELYGQVIDPGEFVSRSTLLKQGPGGWSEVLNFGQLPASHLMYPPEQVVMDADNDGRQELYECYPGEKRPQVLRSGSTAAAATLVALPETARPVIGLNEVPVPSLGRSLLVFHTGPIMCLRYFAGFDLWYPGYGLQPAVRLSPLFTGYATDRNVPIKDTPGRIAAAKLDSDPLPDLVVMGSDSLELEAFLGPLVPALNEYRPWSRDLWGADSLVLADFTGDGVADPLGAGSDSVVVVKTVSQEPAWPEIFFRKHSEVGWTTGNYNAPRRVLGAADFDNDGDLDPLFIRRTDETLAWSRNTGGGTLATPEVISVAGRTWVPAQEGSAGYYRWLTQDQVLTTDADGDGDIDILTAPSALGSRLALHRNLGSAGFSIEPFGPALASELAPSQLLKGKFLASSEAFQMIAFGRNEGLGYVAQILKSSGGTISALPPTPLWQGDAVVAVDFDRDGLDDLITSGNSSWDSFGFPLASSVVLFHRSMGDGSFASPVTLGQTAGVASQLLATDYDQDGLPDLVAASQETGSVEVFKHLQVSALPGFAAWAAGQSFDDPSPEADGDHDGIANILEYATGVDTAPVKASIRLSDYWLSASFPRPRLTDGSSVRVVLQSSGDLENWQAVEAAPHTGVDPLHPQWQILSWQFTVSPSEEIPRLYFRFHVTWQPAP